MEAVKPEHEGAIVRPGNALTATSLVRIAPDFSNGIDDHEPEADCGGYPASYDVPPTADALPSVGADAHVHAPPDGVPGSGDHNYPNRPAERHVTAREVVKPPVDEPRPEP